MLTVGIFHTYSRDFSYSKCYMAITPLRACSAVWLTLTRFLFVSVQVPKLAQRNIPTEQHIPAEVSFGQHFFRDFPISCKSPKPKQLTNLTLQTFMHWRTSCKSTLHGSDKMIHQWLMLTKQNLTRRTGSWTSPGTSLGSSAATTPINQPCGTECDCI